MKKNIITVVIVIAFFIVGFFYLVNEFAKGFGGNIGTITCIDDHQLKDKYLKQYVDSFYVFNPEYEVPDTIQQNAMYQSLDYDHLALSEFYFSKDPIEIYYIQWSGPGCVNIRFVYNPETTKALGVFRGDVDDKIKQQEIRRIKTRFEIEVVPKLEEIILKYESQDSIYLKN